MICCRSDDCKWNEDGWCNKGVISISEDNECEDYESYLDTEEWQQPFYKRCQDKVTKKIFRVLFRGKEIEVNGRKFFIESKSAFATVTDKITGYGCCNRCDLEARFESILKKANELNIPPLESLPLGRYFYEDNRIIPWESQKEGENK